MSIEYVVIDAKLNRPKTGCDSPTTIKITVSMSLDDMSSIFEESIEITKEMLEEVLND